MLNLELSKAHHVLFSCSAFLTGYHSILYRYYIYTNLIIYFSYCQQISKRAKPKYRLFLWGVYFCSVSTTEFKGTTQKEGRMQKSQASNYKATGQGRGNVWIIQAGSKHKIRIKTIKDQVDMDWYMYKRANQIMGKQSSWEGEQMRRFYWQKGWQCGHAHTCA